MVDGDFDLIQPENREAQSEPEFEISENESVQGSAGFFGDSLPGLDLPEDSDNIDMIPADHDHDMDFIPTPFLPVESSRKPLQDTQEMQESGPLEATDTPIDEEIVTIDMSLPYSGITR